MPNSLSVEERLKVLEDFMVDTVPRIQALEAGQNTIRENTAEILEWIRGAKTVYGFTVRHWRSVLKFGAGFALAAGYLSPNIHDFIVHFFGV